MRSRMVGVGLTILPPLAGKPNVAIRPPAMKARPPKMRPCSQEMLLPLMENIRAQSSGFGRHFNPGRGEFGRRLAPNFAFR